MSDQFREWLTSAMEQRHFSQRALARAIGISHPYISRVISGETPPSVDFCIKVAAAFNEPPEKVLRLAGILPPAPDDNPALQEIVELAQTLPSDVQQEILEYVRWQFQRRKG